jgi:hypothetical protein
MARKTDIAQQVVIEPCQLRPSAPPPNLRRDPCRGKLRDRSQSVDKAWPSRAGFG